jgi:hypothetical protein
VSAVAIWFYPGPSNLFIKAGGGGAFLAGSTEVGIDETHGGFGLTTGVGYDIYLGRRFLLTPAIGFWYASPGDLQLADRRSERLEAQRCGLHGGDQVR